jgi:hypothetical protein
MSGVDGQSIELAGNVTVGFGETSVIWSIGSCARICDQRSAHLPDLAGWRDDSATHAEDSATHRNELVMRGDDLTGRKVALAERRDHVALGKDHRSTLKR